MDQIDSVSAEVKGGKHGRSDVAVECVIDGQPTALIIENKIDTTERPDQLAGYVENRRGGAESVRGLLIELGDRPVGSASFPAWDRSDAEGWLNAVRSACAKAHPLVAAYRELFEVWDLAARLRVERLAEIEAINYSNAPPFDWPLVAGWLRPGDTPFFDAVLAVPALRALVERLDLETEVKGRMRADHGHLKLTKASWTIYPDARLEQGVNIHFEAAGRDRVRLDVEVYPYKGLSKNPELQAKFAPLLPAKAAIHRALREALKSKPPNSIEFKGLRAPDRPGANKAAGFPLKPGTSETPEGLAAELVRIVTATSPLIDRVMADLRDELTPHDRSPT